MTKTIEISFHVISKKISKKMQHRFVNAILHVSSTSDVDVDETYRRMAALFPSLLLGHIEWLLVQTTHNQSHTHILLHSVHRLMTLFVLWHSQAPLADRRLKRKKEKEAN